MNSQSRGGRVLARCVVIAAAALLPFKAWCQDGYPSKPVTLVSVGPPGGITDQLARALADSIAPHLGQTIVVDSRGGAGGAIGAALVAKSRADGYTLMLGTQGSQAANQFLYKSLPYDPVHAFASVHAVAIVPNLLVVNADKPWRSVRDFVEDAKRSPQPLVAASAGNGTASHLSIGLFSEQAGIKLTHVPYKGSPPAITDLLANRADLSFDFPATSSAHIQSGRLRALAVLADRRLPVLPNVPTIVESGYPGAQSSAWFGVFAPTGTPEPILTRWRNEVATALADPKVNEAIQRIGGVRLNLVGGPFDDFITAERQKWKAVIQRTGASLE